MTSSLAVTAAEAFATLENERNPRHASSLDHDEATEPTTAMSETASASQTQVTRRMLAGARRRRPPSPRPGPDRDRARRGRGVRGVPHGDHARLGRGPHNARPDLGVGAGAAVNVEEPLQRVPRDPGRRRGAQRLLLRRHFLLTGLFFVWLYRRSENTFATFRNGFFVATSIALIVHWQFPTAPPPLADVGLVDTLRALSGVDIGSRSSEALEPGLCRRRSTRATRPRSAPGSSSTRADAGCASSASSTRCSWC